MNFTNRELNAILVGLRLYQASLPGGNPIDQEWVKEIATNGGVTESLTVEEIDELCKRINGNTLRSIVVILDRGIIEDVQNVPDDIKVEVRDYDIEGLTNVEFDKDEDGKEFFKTIW